MKEILQQQKKPAEAELDDQMMTIKIEAMKCHGMLKLPCIYDVDDLVQEGVIVFFDVYNKYDSTRGASFSTFFYRSLINHLNSILIQSYKRPYENANENRPSYMCVPLGEVCDLVSRLNTLSDLARRYLVFLISPPNHFIAQLVENNMGKNIANDRTKFMVARKYFGMPWEKEFTIRKEILAVLEK